MTKKICSKCAIPKPLSDYYTEVRGSEIYYRPDCKSCNIKSRAKYNKQYRDRANRNNIKYKTGITPELYDELLSQQNNSCAICSRTVAKEGKSLAIDHCHDKMLVRGLLCNRCNRGLGFFQDDPILLAIALNYLTNTPLKDIKYGR